MHSMFVNIPAYYGSHPTTSIDFYERSTENLLLVQLIPECGAVYITFHCAHSVPMKYNAYLLRTCQNPSHCAIQSDSLNECLKLYTRGRNPIILFALLHNCIEAFFIECVNEIYVINCVVLISKRVFDN